MTGPVKLISSKKRAQKPQAAKPQEPQNVKIGGVSFKKDQVEKSSTYTQNGVKMNTVFVKSGVKIDYPDQNKARNPYVEITPTGLSSSNGLLQIYNIENATIYGNPNETDFITLDGKSKNNTVIVDQKASWKLLEDGAQDYVRLGFDTSNNTVKIDKKDALHIGYITKRGKSVDDFQHLEISGEGSFSQERTLKTSINPFNYDIHKSNQEQ